MLDIIKGKWYVHYSNFAMWNHRDICNVNFNYTPLDKDGKLVLLDEVLHQKNGRGKKISGFDIPLNPEATAFTWRGHGLLYFLSCPWKIEWCNAAKNCMVISFGKTLFTQEGIDIICRDKFAPAEITGPAILEAKQHNNLKDKPLFEVARQ